MNRYLVVSGFLDTDTVAALLDRSRELLADFNIDEHPLVGVSTFSSSFSSYRIDPVSLSPAPCVGRQGSRQATMIISEMITS